MNHLPHPLQTPSQCSQNLRSTQVTTNPRPHQEGFLPNKHEAAVVILLSATEQLSLKATGELSLEAGCASTLCLAFKGPLAVRILHLSIYFLPAPQNTAMRTPPPQKSDFSLINKESQVPQHKNTHVQSANFCHWPGTFLSQGQSPVLQPQTENRQPPPFWELASQPANNSTTMWRSGRGLRCWDQRAGGWSTCNLSKTQRPPEEG